MRLVPHRPAFLLLSIAAAVLAAAACGCSDSPISPLGASDSPDGTEVWLATGSTAMTAQVDGPAAASRGAFFPLVLGNRWMYDRTIETQLEIDGTLEPPETFEAAVTRELTQTEELFGRPYVVEEGTVTEGDDTTLEWIRYRQDRAGLYEADVSIIQPPAGTSSRPASRLSIRKGELADLASARRALERRLEGSPHRAALLQAWARLTRKVELVRAVRAHCTLPAVVAKDRPGGVMESELTRLAYPLRPGQEWMVLPDGSFASVVEAHETLDLPAGRMPGWRIRMEGSAFGPNDVVHLWYGRSGFLALRADLESDATDENGEVIGILHYHESQVLQDFDLKREPSVQPAESI
jgi:hypothetical protein